MFTSCTLLAVIALRGQEAQRERSFDAPIEIVISAHDATLAGHGPARSTELTPDFSGTLHAWAESYD